MIDQIEALAKAFRNDMNRQVLVIEVGPKVWNRLLVEHRTTHKHRLLEEGDKTRASVLHLEGARVVPMFPMFGRDMRWVVES